jgi:5-(carboxyamino)imidazole ribonucleotide synthase
LGTLPDRATVLATPGAYLHFYDKLPKPGRKIGHITYVQRTTSEHK